MKKIIALVLCAAMLHGSAGFAERASAAALPETGYSDYVPGDMPVKIKAGGNVFLASVCVRDCPALKNELTGLLPEKNIKVYETKRA